MMFVMHLLVPSESGPIQSGTGPAMPSELVGKEGIGRTFGGGGKYAIACNPALVMDGSVHRGTHVHTPSVSCKYCKQTAAFKAVDAAFQAKMLPQFDGAVDEIPAGCC